MFVRAQKRSMKKKEQNSIDIIKESLLKKAQGYYADEIVEEYVCDSGKEILVKKKVTKKHMPPDLTASKLLLEYFGDKMDVYDNMTDEELDKEAQRLIKEYQELCDEQNNYKNKFC